MIVAPVTSSPGPDLDRYRLAGQQRLVDGGAALGDDCRRWRPSRPGGRRTGRPAASWSIGIARSLPSGVEHRDLLRPELEQRLQRRAGAPLGPRLEIAAGEQERGHDRGDLEVDLRGARRPGSGISSKVIRMPGSPAPRKNSATTDQPQRRERAERDQRVHRRRAVAEVQPGGAVEGPARPRARPASRAAGSATASSRTAAPGSSRSEGSARESAAATMRRRRRARQLVVAGIALALDRRPGAGGAAA